MLRRNPDAFFVDKNLTTYNYVLARGGREAKAREAISLLTELLVVAPVGAEECELALHEGEPDFEDGLVRACAELNDVDFILMRDARALSVQVCER